MRTACVVTALDRLAAMRIRAVAGTAAVCVISDTTRAERGGSRTPEA